MKNKKGQHFTEVQRYLLEQYLKEKRTVKEIAALLQKSEKTIYNEIKRGQVVQLNGHDWIYEKVYKADYAHADYLKKLHQEKHDLKIGNNIQYLDAIEKLVIENHYSFYAAAAFLARGSMTSPVCLTTLYNYYHNDLFLNLKPDHMPYNKLIQKEEFQNRKVALHNLGKTSIEDRPKEILSRSDFGHWEMDTVVGGRKNGKSTLLVLTERASRKEIIIKIPDKKASSVVSALDKLQRSVGGVRKFRDKFKTITVDNGVEFMDNIGIEKNNRTKVYYCHPFCSSERGSNENHNRMIRRWIPKGSNIDTVSQKQIVMINEWMNNYPRKMFNGLSANEYKKYVLRN